MSLVFMFPGQSSRDPAMLERAIRMAPEAARSVLEEASEELHRDLRAHYAGPDPFATNRDVQVGVFVTTHIHLEALRERGIDADISLGLSLGEYNHLVHVGALGFADALHLVDARGNAYDTGPDGAMLAVFPLETEELEEVVLRARSHGMLEIANYNSPTQHVLAGERAAIDAAEVILEEELAVSAVRIEDRVPMHSSIFHRAADAFVDTLSRAPFATPRRPYLPNVLATFEPSAPAQRIRSLLYRHVFSPVRWRESIEMVAAAHPNAVFVEVGPRRVLHGLLSRRWISNQRFATDGEDNPEGALDAMLAEIARAA